MKLIHMPFFHFATVWALSFSGCVTVPNPDPKELSTRLIDSSDLESTTIAHTKDGEVVSVSARIEPYIETRHGRIQMDGTVPETVLRELRVSVGGRDVSPPMSEYARFGDPHVAGRFSALRIEEDSVGLVYVYVSGGDGGGSHGKRFVFSESSWIRTEYRDYITQEYHAPNKGRQATASPSPAP
jgi:hypothetical protein